MHNYFHGNYFKSSIRLNNVLRYFIFCAFLTGPALLVAQTPALPVNTATGKFRAAVVKKNITPQDAQMLLGYDARKSIGVHDSIFHRIVALDDGTTQFF